MMHKSTTVGHKYTALGLVKDEKVDFDELTPNEYVFRFIAQALSGNVARFSDADLFLAMSFVVEDLKWSTTYSDLAKNAVGES